MIKCQNLHKSFGPKAVLRGLNLNVARGEAQVIIGASGCGKSVFLRCLLGLIPFDQGDIHVDGCSVKNATSKQLQAMRLKIGMLFQHAALFDSYTVRENIAFALVEHTHLGHVEIEQRVAECLDLVDLRGIENQYPQELSGGMQKRVAMARALAYKPEILLYDEPTTGLDPITQDVINQLMVQLRDRLSVTCISVTHDMRSAFMLANKIAMVHEGRIRFSGTPDEVRATQDPLMIEFTQKNGIL